MKRASFTVNRPDPPPKIVLVRDTIEQAAMSSMINRFKGHESGQIELTVDDMTLRVERDSQCERADFSRIPQSLF